jgi:hypothetical protein
MLTAMRTSALGLERTYPVVAFGNEPDPPLGLDEPAALRLAARVATVGSVSVIERLDELNPTMRAVGGRAMTMRATEAQAGSVVGEPYMQIENERAKTRAVLKELETAVRADLDSL